MRISERTHAHSVFSLALIVFCVFALIKFSVRGPLRATWNSVDFRSLYVASLVCAQGLDCYDPEALKAGWLSAGVGAGQPSELELRALYPPTTYVLLRPMSYLSWRSAKLVWGLINIAALAILSLCTARVARLGSHRLLWLAAILLAMEPVSTGFMLGQPAIMCATMIAVSLLLVLSGAPILGGAFEGLAVALKPQLAGVVFVAYLINRRLLASVSAVVSFATILAIAFINLRGHPEWIRNYIQNIQHLEFATRWFKTNGYRPINPNLIELLNLRHPLDILSGDKTAAAYIALAIALGLSIAPARTLRRTSAPFDLQQCVSLLLILELLAVYHRAYDASVLAVPLAWSLAPQTPRGHAWPIWLGTALFILPSSVGVRDLGRMVHLPGAITSSVVWNAFIVPYQSWTLLAMAIWMNWLLSGGRVSSDPSQNVVDAGTQPAEGLRSFPPAGLRNQVTAQKAPIHEPAAANIT